MFFVKSNENLIAKENRYNMADGALDGSIPFSLFFHNDNIFFKG
jgi:hypothetical protein